MCYLLRLRASLKIHSMCMNLECHSLLMPLSITICIAFIHWSFFYSIFHFHHYGFCCCCRFFSPERTIIMHGKFRHSTRTKTFVIRKHLHFRCVEKRKKKKEKKLCHNDNPICLFASFALCVFSEMKQFKQTQIHCYRNFTKQKAKDICSNFFFLVSHSLRIGNHSICTRMTCETQNLCRQIGRAIKRNI